MLGRRGDFAGVFAKLGLDVIEPKRAIDICFLRGFDALV